MSEQQVVQPQPQPIVEEFDLETLSEDVDDYFSAEEASSEEEEGEIEDKKQPERRQVGGKAPRFSSKAPMKRGQASKAPRWGSKRQKPMETKPVKSKRHRTGATNLDKSIFVKVTPLAHILRSKLREYPNGQKMRISAKALGLARQYVEQDLLNLMTDVNRSALHAKRKTIMPKDFIFCRILKNK